MLRKITFVLATICLSIAGQSSVDAQGAQRTRINQLQPNNTYLQSQTVDNRMSSFGLARFIGTSDGGADRGFANFPRVPSGLRPIGLLSGFNFEYNIKDHHISTICLNSKRSKTGKGLVALAEFADKNGDDNYKWRGSFLSADQREITTGNTSGEMKGSTKVRLNRPNADDVFVLRGFSLSFGRATDHHIDKISIREVRGELFITYRDKNGDDNVKYFVSYAYIPAKFVRSSEKFEKTAASFVQVERGLNLTGASVISGFEFDLTSSGDAHLQRIGVELVGDSIRVDYGDKHKRRAYNYCVEVTNLRLN